jgi:hypothetical protein
MDEWFTLIIGTNRLQVDEKSFEIVKNRPINAWCSLSACALILVLEGSDGEALYGTRLLLFLRFLRHPHHRN